MRAGRCSDGLSPSPALPAPTFAVGPTPLLAEEYRKEQLDYFSYTAAWTDIHPSQVQPPALPPLYRCCLPCHLFAGLLTPCSRGCTLQQALNAGNLKCACCPLSWLCRWWAPPPASSRTTCTPSRWRSSRRRSRWAQQGVGPGREGVQHVAGGLGGTDTRSRHQRCAPSLQVEEAMPGDCGLAWQLHQSATGQARSPAIASWPRPPPPTFFPPSIPRPASRSTCSRMGPWMPSAAGSTRSSRAALRTR